MDGWIDVKTFLRIDSILKWGGGGNMWMGGKAILRIESIQFINDPKENTQILLYYDSYPILLRIRGYI